MKKLILPLFILALLVAWVLWLPSGESAPDNEKTSQDTEVFRKRSRHHGTASASEEATPAASQTMTSEEATEFAIVAQDDEQYRLLVKAARQAGVLLSEIRALRVVRLRGVETKLKKLLSSTAFSEATITVNHIEWIIPEYEEEKRFAHPGRPFADGALRWLGIDETAENRGKGVTIALLDTAVDANASSLKNVSIQERDLFGLGKQSREATSLHGTMVASVLAGGAGVAGCVPSATILSYPVMNAEGYGSSHNVAQAIVAAVDAGAQIISMSLGFSQNDTLLEMAVAYAASKGVVVVASAGNEGMAASGESTVLYPAAYGGVLAVGAVNADSQRPDFSSTGTELALVAPGVGLLADDGADYVMFSGTSASVPCVTGSLAYLIAANDGLSADGVAKLLLENANDMGLPVDDVEYGLGGVSVERAMNAETPGIFDAAAADVAVMRNADGNVESVFFTAQNRGTEELERMVVVCTLRDTLTGKTLYSEEKVFENVPVGGSVAVQLSDEAFPGRLSATVEVRSSEDANDRNNHVRRTFESTEVVSEQK